MSVIIAKSAAEIFTVIQIRMQVFMMEQAVSPDIEIDDHDPDAVHFLFYDDKQKACACCRLAYIDQHYKIGRLAVLKSERRKGYASILLKAVEDYARSKNISELYLNAQLSAKPLYEKMHYEAFGDIFLEADIEHIAMKKKLL